MKKNLSILVVLMLVASVAIGNKSKAESTQFEVNTKESKINWRGTKVTGEHTGHVSIAKGTVDVQNNAVVSANVKMDMNSIDCTDLSGEWKDKLVGHLKSDDFFSVEKYPEAHFTITSMSKNSNGDYTVTGDLNMKGIKHEIKFPAKVNVAGNEVTAEGTATIDRTKWNIQYGSGKFFQGLGDKLIHDEFSITFQLKATASETLSSN